MSTEIKLPCRAEIHDLENGDKEIRLVVNGRPAFAFVYNPPTNTLREIPRGDLETKGWYRHG